MYLSYSLEDITDKLKCSFATAVNKLERESLDLQRESIRMKQTELHLQRHLKTAEHEFQTITR